ncbi:NAD(P)-dependent oxidoreductase [Legionella jamestowniensis]|uniref:NAD-dependent epimerase/dehydratase n=1 Tax=Legionella jamestowniensis TaxID=455 RepID=A0A0W0ULD7_9GAMM|nr:NAD(P)-dependent oxidoreductase [Legionella jamestowniensis]KTD08722.1 NAD-dependent epimerase/dehydratase [Legionella jamestowniensis]SFL55549.1 Nucleoside-diphosphate-sugar epimerase [Legionella jamestowniensis DSM 19215]
MQHLIIGYGYSGYHLAQYLLKRKESVTAISRHLDSAYRLEGLNHIVHDIEEPLQWKAKETIIYYLIPPGGSNDQDFGLKQFLNHSQLSASCVIYFGSSGVYGNHAGAWVDESSSCHVQNARQQRRLDAEAQWQTYCQHNHIPLVILRIAGIYGVNRLPLEAAMEGTPVINPEQAPYTNHIYIDDLVKISHALVQTKSAFSLYNIADGQPTPIGTLQQMIAQTLGLGPAGYESFEQAWERASPMKKEFLSASKRLSIQALKTRLKSTLHLTPLAEAVTLSLKSQG